MLALAQPLLGRFYLASVFLRRATHRRTAPPFHPPGGRPDITAPRGGCKHCIRTPHCVSLGWALNSGRPAARERTQILISGRSSRVTLREAEEENFRTESRARAQPGPLPAPVTPVPHRTPPQPTRTSKETTAARLHQLGRMTHAPPKFRSRGEAHERLTIPCRTIKGPTSDQEALPAAAIVLSSSPARSQQASFAEPTMWDRGSSPGAEGRSAPTEHLPPTARGGLNLLVGPPGAR